MFNIRYSVCHIKITFNKDAVLNYNKTSGIRGIIGDELIKRNCIKDKKCENCIFNNTCIAYNLFNMKLKKKVNFLSSDRVPPYIIICDNKDEIIRQGEELLFSLILFGDSISMIPELIRSIRKAGLNIGLYGNKFILNEVVNDRSEFIYKDNNYNLEKINIRYLSEYINNRLEVSEDINYINIINPIRFKREGKLSSDIVAEDILNLLVRRIEVLNALEGNNIELNFKNSLKIVDKKLKWIENERYSNRQRGKMKLGGLVGKIVVEVNDIETKKLLIAGELVHIGKSTSFGLGDYMLF